MPSEVQATETRYLIFVRGLKAAEPQLWDAPPNEHSDFWGGRRTGLIRIIGEPIKLDPEIACLPFSEICQKFPAPALPEA